MRSYQIFADMSAEQSLSLMQTLAQETPGMFAHAVQAASLAMKARPIYLKRQPFEKRAAAVRRALARVSANPLAEELLAVYFLDCRKPLLVEWLDIAGIEHEEGTLSDDTPAAPPEEQLRKAVETFRAVDSDPDRELLLRAFAAQDAIEWSALDALLGAAD